MTPLAGVICAGYGWRTLGLFPTWGQVAVWWISSVVADASHVAIMSAVASQTGTVWKERERGCHQCEAKENALEEFQPKGKGERGKRERERERE